MLRPLVIVPLAVALALAPSPALAVLAGPDPGPGPLAAGAPVTATGLTPAARGPGAVGAGTARPGRRLAGRWPWRAVARAGGGVWPVTPAQVVRGFDPPDQPWLPGHRGIDLAAPTGTPVVSASDGTVVFAGLVAGQGVVVVERGGLRVTYEPVAAEVDVGAVVVPGSSLGVVAPADGHCDASAACLHWGLRRHQVYLDPRLLLLPARPVLLPAD